LQVANKIDATLVKFLLEILNKQSIQLGGDSSRREGFQITPEMMEMAKNFLARN
jgi:hypothetical protein